LHRPSSGPRLADAGRRGWPRKACGGGASPLGWQWIQPGRRRAGRAAGHRRPYRYLPHPNYVAVALEGRRLPLVTPPWITALAFTVLSAALIGGADKVEKRSAGESDVIDSIVAGGGPAGLATALHGARRV